MNGRRSAPRADLRRDVTLPPFCTGERGVERLEAASTNYGRNAAAQGAQPAGNRAPDRGGSQDDPPLRTRGRERPRQIPPGWPPALTAAKAAVSDGKLPHPGHRLGRRKRPARPAKSTAPGSRIRSQLGRNAQSIYQDLVEGFGFTHRYNSVKRFVRTLKRREPERFDVLRACPEKRRRSISVRAHRRCIATASTADRICSA